MAVNVDNNQVYEKYRDVSKELNNRELLALAELILWDLSLRHNNDYIKRSLKTYLKCRGLNDGWISDVIEQSLKNSNL